MKTFTLTFPPLMMNMFMIMVQGFQPHLSNPRPFAFSSDLRFEMRSINSAFSCSRVTLSATIYSWDDADNQRSSSYYSFDERSTLDSFPSQNDITELLRQDQERIATLARLAATNCQDSSLILENIRDVHVVAVDSEHIEISAIMCDDESCVTVLVPVRFLNPCNMVDDSGLTECILENILDLDELALQALKQKDLWKKIDSDEFLMKDYLSQSMTSYPSWWISATETQSYSTLKAFQDMKSFLNNHNFEEEIKSFARQLMSNGNSGYQLLRARVTEVGPLGICLRAMVLDKSSSQERGLVIDISHRFDKHVSDADSLRRSVLAAFNE